MLKNNKLLMILAVTMLLIGIACGVAQYFLGGYFYRVAIEDATGIQGADKLQTLLHAIRLQPRRVEAYRLLLDELQEDGERRRNTRRCVRRWKCRGKHPGSHKAYWISTQIS